MNLYPTPCVEGQTHARKRFRKSLLNGDLFALPFLDIVHLGIRFLSCYLTASLRLHASSSFLQGIGDLLL